MTPAPVPAVIHDFATIQKAVAHQIETTGSFEFKTGEPLVEWSTVDYLLRDMAPSSEAIVRRYISSLHHDLTRARNSADILDRAQHGPGNGDMGG